MSPSVWWTTLGSISEVSRNTPLLGLRANTSPPRTRGDSGTARHIASVSTSFMSEVPGTRVISADLAVDGDG